MEKPKNGDRRAYNQNFFGCKEKAEDKVGI